MYLYRNIFQIRQVLKTQIPGEWLGGTEIRLCRPRKKYALRRQNAHSVIHLVCPILLLAYVLILETSLSPNLSFSPNLIVFIYNSSVFCYSIMNIREIWDIHDHLFDKAIPVTYIYDPVTFLNTTQLHIQTRYSIAKMGEFWLTLYFCLFFIVIWKDRDCKCKFSNSTSCITKFPHGPSVFDTMYYEKLKSRIILKTFLATFILLC